MLYILGPGTTTRAIATRLGLPKTLVGVDVITRQALVAADVSERQLLALLAEHPARIVVTPIGGQGFLFGRGNQQISPQVIQKVGRENIILVCLQSKLNALRGQPLLVDTGDAANRPAAQRLPPGHHRLSRAGDLPGESVKSKTTEFS